ncbi:unnamed protein product [Rangifer tarandus platyrhynchus]|uniref:Uncharacterized protein n=2 Tax=Rangifer tarandus platyrhynchus TaxID=3082113 RepID=A0ABN8YYK5_RANTA|nr:unnamed protein product [Rangifer tarandus platyrhynchus]CAI9703085.1 unnamed protein product [Rangifer tarandus platyrhynchus]
MQWTCVKRRLGNRCAQQPSCERRSEPGYMTRSPEAEPGLAAGQGRLRHHPPPPGKRLCSSLDSEELPWAQDESRQREKSDAGSKRGPESSATAAPPGPGPAGSERWVLWSLRAASPDIPGQVPERRDPVQGKQTGGWSQRWHRKGLGAEQRAPWQPRLREPALRLHSALHPASLERSGRGRSRSAPPPTPGRQEQRREEEAGAQD